jgi:energy-converting hydrogenase Eha subunit A
LDVPDATVAPRIAMPREPPTWRIELSTADPTPALATGTDRIAAAVVGVIDIARPIPPMLRPGSSRR